MAINRTILTASSAIFGIAVVVSALQSNTAFSWAAGLVLLAVYGTGSGNVHMPSPNQFIVAVALITNIFVISAIFYYACVLLFGSKKGNGNGT